MLLVCGDLRKGKDLGFPGLEPFWENWRAGVGR